MGPFGIVGVGPVRHGVAAMVDAEEQGLVQKLVTHPAVERFAVAVLHRLSGGDVVPLHTCSLAPGRGRHRGQLGAVVGDDQLGPSALGNQHVELACDPEA